MLSICRSAYYKWLKAPQGFGPDKEEWLRAKVVECYAEHNGIYGVRRIAQTLTRESGTPFNHKRIRRVMRRLGLSSVIRRKRKNYIPSTPEVTAQNLLGRDFTAERPNQKWLTDVTELKYGLGQKAYLSAFLDLGDNSIVSYVLGHRNNNALVFETFDRAVKANPYAQPLVHSDRGFQYTSKVFRAKLDQAGCVQSMSRVGRCIDNGPMEGFWGILKCEMFYLRKFDTFVQLKQAVEDYILFYNTKRYLRKYKGLAPLEVRNQALAA